MSLWENVAGGYTLFKSLHTGAKTHSLSLPVQLYAEIALDLNVREIAERLFTYEIPAHMRSQVFIGSQVLVPFGARDLVSGFVVSIGERRQGGAREDPPLEKMRPIAEVIETEPFFDSQYIEFLYYVSEYYFCSIGDVLSAAIPQGISAKIKRTVRLVETAGEDRQTNILCQEFAL